LKVGGCVNERGTQRERVMVIVSEVIKMKEVYIELQCDEQ